MKKPKIRFKGYQEDWEQRKLVDLVDRVTRKNQDLEIGRASCRERVSSPV